MYLVFWSDWFFGRSVGRSIGQQICRSVRLSVLRSVDRSVDRSVGQSVGRSVGRLVCRSCRWAGRSICLPVDRSLRRSKYRRIGPRLSIRWSVGRSGDRRLTKETSASMAIRETRQRGRLLAAAVVPVRAWTCHAAGNTAINDTF